MQPETPRAAEEGKGGSYVADVLEGGEAEGRQVVRQGFSNAGCAPALGEEGGRGVSTRPWTAPHQARSAPSEGLADQGLLIFKASP